MGVNGRTEHLVVFHRMFRWEVSDQNIYQHGELWPTRKNKIEFCRIRI
jgi:hypothetical protein